MGPGRPRLAGQKTARARTCKTRSERLIRLIERSKTSKSLVLWAASGGFAISCGMGDLGGFAGAAEVHADEVNDLVSRSRHLVSAALPVPCAFSSASGPLLAAPLAVLAGGTTTRDPHPRSGPTSRRRACCCLGLGRLSREPADAVLSSTPAPRRTSCASPFVVG